MNSIWNKNIGLFEKRFPALFDVLRNEINSFKESDASDFKIQEAKNGMPILLENNVPLHSRYNPAAEAQKLCSTFDKEKKDAAVFLGFGLGYAPICFAESFPGTSLIIIESDCRRLLFSFMHLDWEKVFSMKQIVFAVTRDVGSIVSLVNRFSFDRIQIYSQKAQTAHDSNFFDSVAEELKKLKQKEEINTNTLEKFAHLWLSNSCRNIRYIGSLEGVDRYSQSVRKKNLDLPFVILAAGPSLETILPHLSEIKKRAIIVCVDTALHACLRVNVEPDFIVLLDPQYACAMHLEFLESKSSILITEVAAYPSVFRFRCREIILASSMFPVGQFFEKDGLYKGTLKSGGSVATSSWDFARHCGTDRIFIAGMDLGFPGKQTHIRGSQFEERSHRTSTKLSTAENDNVSSLFSAYPGRAKNYFDEDFLTDKRMSLFSWWFEQSCRVAKEEGTLTYCLTPQSMAIKNIEKFLLEDFLKLPEKETERKIFLQQEKKAAPNENHIPFEKALSKFRSDLNNFCLLAKKGISLCQKAIENRTRANEIFQELNLIDQKILGSGSKDSASLVFPTQRQLEKLTKNLPEDKLLNQLYFSRIVYRRILKSAEEILENFI